VHPDVRSILLTQKAFAEGGRALVYYASAQGDILTRSQDPEARRNANEVLRLLTPIIKAFLTETGFESANLGMQCLGGHGYIMFSGYTSDWNRERRKRRSIGRRYRQQSSTLPRSCLERLRCCKRCSQVPSR
jgi:alkylation response protein AidB-like acyl-CoA dehydrogenase